MTLHCCSYENRPYMNNDLSVKKRIELFDKIHGDFVLVGEQDGFLLFADGAVRAANPYGLLKEPPADPNVLARQLLRFAEKRCELAREEFMILKQNMLSHVKHILSRADANAPTLPPDRESIVQLKKLQMKVDFWQEKVREARAEVKNTEPEYKKRRKTVCDVNRRKAQEVEDEISKISI